MQYIWNPNRVDCEYLTTYCRNSTVERVQWLMDEHGEEDVVNQVCPILNERYTCLHLAAHAVDGEYLELMTLLLDAGADIEATTMFENMTPLHYAANYKHPNSIALLLDRGADIEAVAGKARKSAEKRGTALTLAIAKEAPVETKLLISRGASLKNAEQVSHAARKQGICEQQCFNALNIRLLWSKHAEDVAEELI